MRRYLTSVIAIILLLGSYYFLRTIGSKQNKRIKKGGNITQAVTTTTVKNGVTPIQIKESGQISAKDRIEIYAEVQGIMEESDKDFDIGIRFNTGDVLVNIQSIGYYATLQAQKSILQNLITNALPDLHLDYPEAYQKWAAYTKKFNINKPIDELPNTTSDKERNFITAKNIYTTYYQTKNLEITFQKYKIKAPFKGVVTEALVSPGVLVRAGQKLGEFINTSAYEMEVSISSASLGSLSAGKKVKLQDANNLGKVWEGVITRINEKIDTYTQTIQVFIELRGKGLKEGMYLEATMEGNPIEHTYEVSSNLLVEGTKLFVVNQGLLDEVEVSILHKKQKSVVVEGLEDGMQLVTKPIAGGYVGMPVLAVKEN